MDVTVWSDGFIDSDCQEIVHSEGRGAPKKWRLPNDEFAMSMQQQIGSVGSDLVKLLK